MFTRDEAKDKWVGVLQTRKKCQEKNIEKNIEKNRTETRMKMKMKNGIGLQNVVLIPRVKTANSSDGFMNNKLQKQIGK